MKHTFIVTADVDEAALRRINDGRTRMKQQLHDEAEFCENLIIEGLQSGVVPDVKVRELKLATKTRFRASGDVHATT